MKKSRRSFWKSCDEYSKCEIDLANYTPASAEKDYLSAARYLSPELLSRFEPIARAQLKQVVTNRISQFFAVDSEKVAGKDPLVVGFTGERITYVGRTETERKPFRYRVTLQHVERTQQNPHELVVSLVKQGELTKPLTTGLVKKRVAKCRPTPSTR